MADDLDLIIKWNGKEISLPPFDSETACLGDLRNEIYRLTRVRPSNQKILGIKLTGNQGDETILSALKLKKGAKLMMMGQPDEVIVRFSFVVVFNF